MKGVAAYISSKKLTQILVFYFAVGVAGLVIPASRELFMKAVPFTLLGSLIILLLHHGKFTSRTILAGLLIFAAGFGLEVIGVATGLLFGEYQYGATLGLKLFHTPLVIGVNWLILIYCSMVIAARFVEPLYFRAIVAGSMMVIYDIALEPVAIRLDMWSWSGGTVPLQSYLAWFVIAVVLGYLAGKMKLAKAENKLAAPLFFIQLAFFIALDLWIVAEKIWG
jgi:uncharacterized membrane protein